MVFVVVVAFFLFYFIDFSLLFFFSVTTSKKFFVWVEIVSVSTLIETTTRCVDIGFAFKASGHFAIGKSAGFFGAHSVQAQQRWG